MAQHYVPWPRNLFVWFPPKCLEKKQLDVHTRHFWAPTKCQLIPTWLFSKSEGTSKKSVYFHTNSYESNAEKQNSTGFFIRKSNPKTNVIPLQRLATFAWSQLKLPTKPFLSFGWKDISPKIPKGLDLLFLVVGKIQKHNIFIKWWWKSRWFTMDFFICKKSHLKQKQIQEGCVKPLSWHSAII